MCDNKYEYDVDKIMIIKYNVQYHKSIVSWLYSTFILNFACDFACNLTVYKPQLQGEEE